MKNFLLFLGLCFVSVCQGTIFGFGRKSAPVEPEGIIPNILLNAADLTPDDILQLSQLYSSNGFGYLPNSNDLSIPEYLTQIGLPALQRFLPGLQNLPQLPNSLINIGVSNQPVATIPTIAATIPTFINQILLPQTDDSERQLLSDPSSFLRFGNVIPTYDQEILQEIPLAEEKLAISDDVEIENNLALPNSVVPLDFQTSPIFVTNDTANEGEYSNSYVLNDGTKVFEEGHLVRASTGNDVIVKSGRYEYVDDNGKIEKVNWIADEHGFRVLH